MELLRQYTNGTAAFVNTADAVKDWRMGGPATATVAAPRFLGERIAKIPLAAADTGGGVFAWQNDEGATIIVTSVRLYVTTVATAAGTVDIGTTATNATTSSDNLIDGLDVHSATGLFSNTADGGTNGKTHQTLAAGKWITASKASGAMAGLVGFAYIRYTLA